MHKVLKSALTSVFAVSMLMNMTHIEANNLIPTPTSFTWQGTTDTSLTTDINWSPILSNHPAAGDTAVFDSSVPPSNFTPTLSSMTSANTFAVDLAKFTSSNAEFTINIQDPGTSFTFAGSGAGPVYGVQNNSGIQETFNITNEGQLIFQNTSSADSEFGETPGLMLYQVGDEMTPGSVVFQNQSSAGGATFILESGSTIIFEDASSAENATFNTNDLDSITFALNAISTFNGEFVGTGTINVNGTAELILSGNSSQFEGITNVNGGNLVLDNKLGGDLIVNADGTVSGHGGVSGSLYVNKNGTISPGNSIGRIIVGDIFSQAPNSTFKVNVDKKGQTSRIFVWGQGIINPNAQLVIDPETAQLPPNKTIASIILRSELGVSGTYDSILSTNPLITPSLIYDATNVILKMTNTLSLISQTSNQKAITDELQILDYSNAQIEPLKGLALLPKKSQQHALNQLTAQPYANMLLNSEITNRKFIRRLYNPLRTLATSYTCFETCSSCEGNLSTWFDGGWNHGNFKGNSKGFSLNGYELSLGAQSTLDNCWTIGLAGSYEMDHLKYQVGGKEENQTFMGGLYTLYRPADFYVLADVILGYSQNKIKRHIDIGTFHFKARSKPDVFQGTLYIEAGQDFALDCFLLQPFIGIESGYLRHDHIHEHSSNALFNVNVRNQSYGSACSRLGAHFLTEFSCFKMYLDAAWQYRMTSWHNRSRQTFQQFGGTYSIKGLSLARNSFDGAVNLSANLADGLEIYAEAEGQWWKNASSYTLLAGMVFSW